MAIRLILFGLVLLGLLYWAMLPQSGPARRWFHRWVLRLSLAALVLLLLRLGLPWLAAAGAVLVAGLRFAAPILLRLAPVWFAGSLRRKQGLGGTNEAPPAKMTRSRALEVLNLREGATREEVLSAHRELIKRVHPDRGGSSYLASEVNQARDVLLSD